MGYNTILLLNEFTIIANRQSLVFVTACVATAAYYLLTLLILFTKELSWKKMLKMFVVGALLILIMNIVRVIILIVVLFVEGSNWFELIHIAFWKFVSTIFVFFVLINCSTSDFYSRPDFVIDKQN